MVIVEVLDETRRQTGRNRKTGEPFDFTKQIAVLRRSARSMEEIELSPTQDGVLLKAGLYTIAGTALKKDGFRFNCFFDAGHLVPLADAISSASELLKVAPAKAA